MDRAIREGEADQKTIRGIVFPLTVKRHHYDSDEQPKRHLRDFVDVYDFGRRLKTLNGLRPYEFICKCWTSEPERFRLNPIHQMPGLNTRTRSASVNPRQRMKESRSLTRYPVRSFDSEWLARGITTRNISM